MKKIGFLLALTSLFFTSCVVQTVELQSISIIKAPSKTEYFVGEKIDVSGMEVTAFYSDESAKVLSSEDYTCSPKEALTLEDTKIVVSYTDVQSNVTKSAEIAIKVTEKQTETVDASDDENETENQKEEETENPSSDENNKNQDDDNKTAEQTSTAKNNSSIDYSSAKANYTSAITIEEKIGTTTSAAVTEINETNKTIILKSSAENPVFVIKGYYEGQIIVKKEQLTNLGADSDPVITLEGAYIENKNGKPAILSDTKIEISVKNGTENYIISDGEKSDKTGAIHCEKTENNDTKSVSVEIGGKGTLFVIGNVYHGIKAKDVEFKGNVKAHITASESGSCINCKDFEIKADKKVELTLSDAKNGIKADNTISISSGIINLKDLICGLKTDTKADDEEGENKTHSISLANCTLSLTNVLTNYETEENGYSENNVTK